jgi:hypothetical protein
MTKERVLNSIWNHENADLELQTCITLSPDLRLIEEAMDQYPKQQSIGFAEWVAIDGWYLNKIKRWSNRGNTSNNLIEVLSSTKSTDELYTLYQETQSKIIQ